MKKTSAIFGIAALVGAIVFLACCNPEKPIEEPKVNYPDLPAPDGKAAMELVRKQIDFGPRTVNSEAAKNCAGFIAEFAKELGYKVTIDKWTEGSGNNARTFRNVICERIGAGSQFVVLGSHYDTKILPNFVGANDGGSSTALLMQVMKDIAKSDKWKHHCSMRFVFFDGEEAVHMYSAGDGLNGSNRYAFSLAAKGENTKCRGMILMDMVGDKDFKLTIPSNSTASLIRKTEAIAKHLKLEKHVSRFDSGDFIDDHKPFLAVNIPAIDLIDFEYGVVTEDNGGGSYWHTPEDTIDKLSPDSLEKCGLIFKHLLWQLSNNPVIKK